MSYAATLSNVQELNSVYAVQRVFGAAPALWPSAVLRPNPIDIYINIHEKYTAHHKRHL